jgi:hypothetical protein
MDTCRHSIQEKVLHIAIVVLDFERLGRFDDHRVSHMRQTRELGGP